MLKTYSHRLKAIIFYLFIYFFFYVFRSGVISFDLFWFYSLISIFILACVITFESVKTSESKSSAWRVVRALWRIQREGVLGLEPPPPFVRKFYQNRVKITHFESGPSLWEPKLISGTIPVIWWNTPLKNPWIRPWEQRRKDDLYVAGSILIVGTEVSVLRREPYKPRSCVTARVARKRILTAKSYKCKLRVLICSR
jgi:hypothetical protein